MKYTIITLFPTIIEQYLSLGIIGRAKDLNKIQVEIVDLRQYGKGKRKNVDSPLYGGGHGMVISVDVLDKALLSIEEIEQANIYMLSPRGVKLTQTVCKQIAKESKHIVLICGHYEGVDERIYSLYNIQEISIGDYILTGGELPALVLIDSVTRLLQGVLKEGVTSNESFENNLLEEPQYTKPKEYKGLNVPQILLSGNHAEVEKYRYEEKIKMTKRMREDLLKKE